MEEQGRRWGVSIVETGAEGVEVRGTWPTCRGEEAVHIQEELFID